ncbi:hypothetical protein [Jannaschia marina]|uniref:hypothetical protein n=1 Tax=Jannaschia marina TaxID=2741674 RepID=UPI001F486C8E|nr:hypothetical protein [Jannaschia marina]
MSGVGEQKRRPAPFSLRLTVTERAAFERKAGDMALGAYIKSVVLADEAPKVRKSPKPPVAETQLLAEVLARLGQSGTARNLAQIADGIQRGTLVVDEELEDDLKRAIAEVAWMRVTLMRALGVKP